jgi:hypothetical protein
MDEDYGYCDADIENLLEAFTSIYLLIGLKKQPIKYCGEEYYTYSTLKTYMKVSKTALDAVLYTVKAVAIPYDHTFLISLKDTMSAICEYNKSFMAKDKFLQEILFERGL